MSMELVVDSLTKQYLANAPTETVTSPSRDSVDVEVSSLRLRILQILMDVDEIILPLSTTSQPPDSSLHAPETSRIVSDIVLSLYNLTASFAELSNHPHAMSKPLTTFRGSFSQVKAHLDLSVLYSLSRTNRTSQALRQCAFEMAESKILSTSDNLHVKLGDTRVQFLGRASPEIMTVTLHSLLSVVRESVTYTERAGRFKMARQYQVSSIFLICRNIYIDDPLAVTRPSLLVQSGRPQRMRSDATWKLFMYLRYCLRFLDVSQKEMISSLSDSSDPPVQMDDLLAILQDKLAGWGVELPREEVALLPLIRICFPSTQSFADKPHGLFTHLPVISFYSGTLVFSVSESSTTSLDNTLGNTLSLGPLHLVYRQKARKLTMLPAKISAPPGGTILSDLDSTSTRHHVLSAVVDDVCYTIHPSFILFLQRLLRLHGKYASSSPVTSTPSLDVSRRLDDYWECFVALRHMSVQAAVEGIVLAVGLTNINLVTSVLQATPLPRSQSRLRPSISGHSLLNASQLYTGVRQAYDRTQPFSSNGRDILASLAFSSLMIDSTYRITGEHPAVIHGLLAMDSLMLSVPRSALLTYRLIEEWRTQYLPLASLSSTLKCTDDTELQEHTRYDERAVR